jgi:hypothetical protein
LKVCEAEEVEQVTCATETAVEFPELAIQRWFVELIMGELVTELVASVFATRVDKARASNEWQAPLLINENTATMPLTV